MSVTVHACFQRSRSAVSSLAAQTQPIQLQLQTTADLLHLAMNVDICITLARRYVADIVMSGEPLSQNLPNPGVGAMSQTLPHQGNL